MTPIHARAEQMPATVETRPMAPRVVVYFGCAPIERREIERQFEAAMLRVVWTESVSETILELSRRNLPVLIDLVRGGAALQAAKALRAQFPAATLIAVAD